MYVKSFSCALVIVGDGYIAPVWLSKPRANHQMKQCPIAVSYPMQRHPLGHHPVPASLPELKQRVLKRLQGPTLQPLECTDPKYDIEAPKKYTSVYTNLLITGFHCEQHHAFKTCETSEPRQEKLLHLIDPCCTVQVPEGDGVGCGHHSVACICHPVDEELVGNLRCCTCKGAPKEVHDALWPHICRCCNKVSCNL